MGTSTAASGASHRRARTPKESPGVCTFQVEESLPPVGRAASLAMALLTRAKADTWEELARNAAVPGSHTRLALATIHLTAEQLELLGAWPVVTQVSVSTPRRGVSVCPVCEEVVLYCGSSPPRRCLMTLRCPGELVRVAPAALVPMPADRITAPVLAAQGPVEQPESPEAVEEPPDWGEDWPGEEGERWE